jgi:hypothetical protein
LRNRAEGAASNTSDRVARAHLQDVARRIDRALEPGR